MSAPRRAAVASTVSPTDPVKSHRISTSAETPCHSSRRATACAERGPSPQPATARIDTRAARVRKGIAAPTAAAPGLPFHQIRSSPPTDRKSGVKGKSVYVRVTLGGGRILQKKKNKQN